MSTANLNPKYSPWEMLQYVVVGIAIAFLLIFVCSCSPQKRLNRLHKKHPELWTNIVYDTIIHDTTYINIVIPGDSITGELENNHTDSLQPITDTERETVYIWKDRDKIRYKVVTKPFAVHDTIVKSIPIQIPCNCPTMTCELSRWEKIKRDAVYFLLVAFGIIIGFIGGRVTR